MDATNLLEKGRYVFRVVRCRIKAILGIEQRARFAVDGVVHTKEPNCKLLSLIVTNLKVKRFLVQ
jgi:hypothetical protein